MTPTSVPPRFRSCLVLRNWLRTTHCSHRVNVPNRSIIGIVQGNDLYMINR